jgi:hypothetical protein
MAVFPLQAKTNRERQTGVHGIMRRLVQKFENLYETFLIRHHLKMYAAGVL